jgi:hypothetical protein
MQQLLCNQNAAFAIYMYTTSQRDITIIHVPACLAQGFSHHNIDTLLLCMHTQ